MLKGLLQDLPKRKKSEQSEKKFAKEHGGHFVKGSGSNKNAPGDVYLKFGDKKYLVEIKETDKSQIILKKDWLEQLKKEAFENLKIPILHLRIQEMELNLMFEEDFFIEREKEND